MSLRRLRLANWELLRLHFGDDVVYPPEHIFAHVVTKFDGDQGWRSRFFLYSLLTFLVSGYLVNLNRSSMHNFYRDRLSNAWIGPPMRDDPNGKARPEDSTLPLKDLANSDVGLPYLLISGTLNFFDDKYFTRRLGATVDSEEQGKPDSETQDKPATELFLFSKQYCGSSTLGYTATRQYYGGTYDLANAMAVSGAAVSPVLSENWLVVFLLFLSNLRLGQWLENPDPQRGAPSWFWGPWWLRFGPAPLPVILDQLFRRAKDREFCFVTDGGHHENLGITALLCVVAGSSWSVTRAPTLKRSSSNGSRFSTAAESIMASVSRSSGRISPIHTILMCYCRTSPRIPRPKFRRDITWSLAFAIPHERTPRSVRDT